MTAGKQRGIKVTTLDLETGDTEEVLIWDNYVVICAGNCWVDHEQHYKNGTVNLTIKRPRA